MRELCNHYFTAGFLKTESAVCESKVKKRGASVGEGIGGLISHSQQGRGQTISGIQQRRTSHVSGTLLPLAHFSPLRDHLWALRLGEDVHTTRLHPWG